MFTKSLQVNFDKIFHKTSKNLQKIRGQIYKFRYNIVPARIDILVRTC